jgi:hypothetical protein
MRTTKMMTSLAATVALAFLAQKAQACNGMHVSVTGTGAADSGCIFNVDTSMDAELTSIYVDANFTNGTVGESFAPQGEHAGEQALVQNIVNSVNGQAPGGTVNYNDSESIFSFTIPAGAQEVTITLTDSNGVVSSATDVLVNGTFQAASGGQGPCGPIASPPPPAPPVNTAVPGPGLNPQDNESAVNDFQGANLPMNEDKGGNEAAMTGYIK